LKKIAITQRIIENNTYYEIRDCLDTNWIRIFQSLNIIPLIIPTGFNIENYYNSGIKLDGIILSGGNDLTIFDDNKLSQQRDKFELEILSYAIKNKIPLMGICRGMQLITSFWKGKFEVNIEHIAKRHKIITNKESKYFESLSKIKEVNSYHKYCIKSVSNDFIISAQSEDGLIEAIEHKEFPIFAQMWHSEREEHLNKNELDVFRELFRL
jgi:gamma-glutamyl-gamma-aminobutyrate hydrolase PuuD